MMLLPVQVLLKKHQMLDQDRHRKHHRHRQQENLKAGNNPFSDALAVRQPVAYPTSLQPPAYEGRRTRQSIVRQ